MREQYDLDTHYGKYDSLMACFMFEQVLMSGDFGDDEYSDGEGTWGSRYGRRVLEGDDRGFVYYSKLDTVEQATVEFRKVADAIEASLEDVDA